MSIKPVDFQVMLPKTSEVSKLNHDEQHKSQLFQQQQAADAKNKVEDNLRQVYSKDKLHKANIKEKQEKENKKQGKKENKSNYDGTKKSKTENQTSIIDIKL